MDRRDKILYKCDLNGRGLEIGASINPIVPKKDGYNVETIDHLDKQGLIEKYSSHGKETDKIEDVDYIWNGESYTQLTGKEKYYDYIIASHVLEHTCDLVGFLCDCSKLLKDNGVLSLAIPDKRFCFDYLRPVTGISKVIDRHINKCTFNTPGSVYEYLCSVCSSDNNLAWNYPQAPDEVNLIHGISYAVKAYNEVLSDEKYIDIHNWVLTKSTFELIIYDLNCLNLIDLVVAAGFEVEGHEFFISLTKRNEPFKEDDKQRLKLAIKAKKEIEPIDTDAFYTDKINGLNKNIKEQKEQISELNEQILQLYNSKTWKTGEKIQKIYRFLMPGKLRNTEEKSK